MKPTRTTLIWFRQDLRLADNPALTAACDDGAVIPVYIWAPREEDDWPIGAAGRWWLHHALSDLDRELRRRGSRLVIRQGDSLSVLSEIAVAGRVERVVWNRRYEPATVARDAHVHAELTARGLRCEVYNGSLLFDPDVLRNRSGGRFTVFTPFWDACLELDDPDKPATAPRRITPPKRWPKSLGVDALDLLPKDDWAGGIATAWQPTERAGCAAIKRFMPKLRLYPNDRDRPDLLGTSRLSPYLHWGQVGPGQLYHAVREYAHRSRRPNVASGASAFIRQLGWREFAYYLLAHFPSTPSQPLRANALETPWTHDPRMLRAWRRGRTGYPLVDAGMRQLWRTGWMHNRVRMVVASFLVKHLMIDWRTGAKWFWDTLVDADLANNTLGWQWASGCGADAVPYFRVFNPLLQQRKYDPHGKYVGEYVPECVVKDGGVVSYPPPIVDHADARKQFLASVGARRRIS